MKNRRKKPSDNHMLPNLFIVGAARAGTTSLCNALSTHNDIFLPHEKEPHFFMFNDKMDSGGISLGFSKRGRPLEQSKFIKDINKYKNLYTHQDALFRMDGSTQYFASGAAAKRIRENIPNAKIIIQLREPLSRAWSAYSYAYAKGEESSSFIKAISEEFSGKREKRFYGGYLNTSNYGIHVARYMELFGEKNVLTTYFEKYKEDPDRIFSKIFSFLDIGDIDVAIPGNSYNPTIITSNAFLRFVRHWLTRTRAHYGWTSRIPFAKAFHSWLLTRSKTKVQRPSDEDRACFMDLLSKQSKSCPLNSIIGNHPYRGV